MKKLFRVTAAISAFLLLGTIGAIEMEISTEWSTLVIRAVVLLGITIVSAIFGGLTDIEV